MTMSVNELAAELKTLTPAQIDLIAAALNLAKKEAPCTVAAVQNASVNEPSKAQEKNTTYRRSYQDLLFGCTIGEVDEARRIFDAYMKEHMPLLDAPEPHHMSKDVLLNCSLSAVWKAAKLYFAEHAERCPR